MSDKPQKKALHKSRLNQQYLEIYIKDNGTTILTPVTAGTVPFLRRLKPGVNNTESIYCG